MLYEDELGDISSEEQTHFVNPHTQTQMFIENCLQFQNRVQPFVYSHQHSNVPPASQCQFDSLEMWKGGLQKCPMEQMAVLNPGKQMRCSVR